MVLAGLVLAGLVLAGCGVGPSRAGLVLAGLVLAGLVLAGCGVGPSRVGLVLAQLPGRTHAAQLVSGSDCVVWQCRSPLVARRLSGSVRGQVRDSPVLSPPQELSSYA